jgi:hypothetical protein
MPELVAMIQTTWSNIRVGLYRCDDGQFQFVEEGFVPDENGSERWVHFVESERYDQIEAAREAMIEHYCLLTEDEYRVAPESVTILEAPNFRGPHHPKLIVR